MAWNKIGMAAAESGATQVGSMGMGMLDEALFGNRRRRKQLEQQQKLTEMQVGANKELADYGLGIQKEMFEATGYGAQRKQMEAAGLNPALMYGHAGAGGSTGQGGAGSAGMGQASDEMSRKAQDTARQGMALQAGMQRAQIRNLEADAKAKEADAAKTAGVDTELVQMNIDDIIENIKDRKVIRAGNVLQNDFDRIRNVIQDKTSEDAIKSVSQNVDYMDKQLDIIANSKDISDETKRDVIESYRLQNRDIIANIMSKEQGIKMSEAQIVKMIEDVQQGWEDLRIKGEQVDVGKTANMIKEKYPTMNQVGGGLLNGFVHMIDRVDQKVFPKLRKWWGK